MRTERGGGPGKARKGLWLSQSPSCSRCRYHFTRLTLPSLSRMNSGVGWEWQREIKTKG